MIKSYIQNTSVPENRSRKAAYVFASIREPFLRRGTHDGRVEPGLSAVIEDDDASSHIAETDTDLPPAGKGVDIRDLLLDETD